MREMPRRFGVFTLPTHLVDARDPVVWDIMARVIVLKAEHLFHADGFEYTAYCEDFDELQPGDLAPRYSAVLSGGKLVRWEKLGWH
jgi:hypothetical protein